MSETQLKPFDKNEAINVMLHGMAVMPYETQYCHDSSYFCFKNNIFLLMEIPNSNIAKISEKMELHEIPDIQYILYTFVPKHLPQYIWNSNIDKAKITKLTFNRIYKQHQAFNPRGNSVWAICEYKDDNGKLYGVKFERFYNEENPNLLIQTTGMHFNKQEAEHRLRSWVTEYSKHQRKSSKNLKSTLKVEQILNILPEIFI